MNRIRQALPTVIALAIHGIVAAVLVRGPAPPPRSEPTATVDLAVDLAIEVAAEETLADPAPTTAPPAGARSDAARAPQAAMPQALREAPEAEADLAAVGAAAEPAPMVTTREAPPDLGIWGRQNPFMPRSEAAVAAAESKRAVDRALRDPARDKERALGLGPEGPVLSALASGTARSVAPVRGRAVFVATADASGQVVSVELLDAEGGRPGWADAARIALEELHGKKLRLASGTSRAVMRIEVTSAWKLPSGQDPGMDVSLMHIPLSKGEGKGSAKMSIVEPKVVMTELIPGVQIPMVQIVLFGTNADPTNIGAKPLRVIHTHVIDTRMM